MSDRQSEDEVMDDNMANKRYLVKMSVIYPRAQLYLIRTKRR